ncbi:Uncharacterized protein PCOAH_00010020 [Plasmodium coatneyi]|uniref:Sporozoite invasion-associated protein 2 n=1 Tax=Plasmodium coatneyi TaxID=208452 RepID=A0A1B1DVG8_9APIC|nr:Uncharacterized protein PCOAH_00010020 [Plasmodium coatneyi]ANQ06734.1 Uncharacterized protein PCOAH_00010020 [Plasmodium coatneyi]
MEAQRKYHCYHSLLISIGTLLLFTNTFMLCSSSQFEPAPNPEPASSPPAYLLEHDYAPSVENIFGPHASQIITQLYENIDEDVTTTGGYKNRPDDDQSDQSSSEDDAVMLTHLNDDTDSFDDLMEEIDSHKKKKKAHHCPLRKNVFRRPDSDDYLSDYEVDDEVLGQTEYEQLQEGEDDSFLDDSFEVVDYTWKDILQNSPYNTYLTDEDGVSSFEELELDDSEQEVKLGNLKFFGVEDPNLSKKEKTIIAPTTTKSNLEKNGKNSEASHINKDEQEKMDKRKRRTRKHLKNPIEGFSVTTSYDSFLKQHGLRDHPSQYQKESGEPFTLNEYYYRDARFENVRMYALKMLYDNIIGLGKKEYQYLKDNKNEVELFIKGILRNSFICLTFSEEDQLFDDAHRMIDKVSMKSMYA